MKLIYNVVCVHTVYTTYMQAMDLDDLRQIGDDFSGVTLLWNRWIKRYLVPFASVLVY